ncbi:MAG: hypothetical protein ACT4P4_27005 [Betaproteobacteria bacterium]
MRFLKPLLLAAAAVASFHAQAQLPAIGVPPALEVQRLAPQLVAFFGPSTNFQSLVNGLATGGPVTLTTVGADGLTRVVTFTPTLAMPALQIAQVLESARQSLISRGIAAPTAEQTAITLAGGTLTTATGTVQTTALVPTTPAAGTTAGLTGSAAAGGTAQSPAVTVQQQATPTTPGGVPFTSASPLPRGVSDTPPLPVPGTPGAGTGTPPAATAPIAVDPASGTTATTTGTTGFTTGGTVATPPATATGTTTPPATTSSPAAIRR